MITLTRLSGSTFVLNCDLIERVDSTPDTVVSLIDGKKYVVSESLPEIIAAVRSYRSGLIAESAVFNHAPVSPDHARAVAGDPTSPARLAPVTVFPALREREARPTSGYTAGVTALADEER